MLRKRVSKKLENLTHELKNGLAVIKAYTQILEKRLGNPSDKKSLDLLEKINTEVDKLVEILKKGEKRGREES